MDRTSLIAVVGMDGIFPGALNLDIFWQNIIGGVDQSRPAPPSRWIAPVEDRLRSTTTPDRPYSRHACLIDDFHFEPDGFSLDPDLTRHLDPVHQLTLTAGKRAVGGCQTGKVDFSRVDTILAAIALPTDGASAYSRQLLGRAIERRLFPQTTAKPFHFSRAETLASRVDGLPAALLAAEMGFGGDSFTLDAACASSIYAVKLACDALVAGRTDMVVTGGVSRPECLYTQTGFSQLQALSASGRCAPFDHRADGLVVGEGVGILVLKRLTDALTHGDTILGVIHGIGLSNDMRGNLLAPERQGQLRAMQAAYAAAGWQPSDVNLIECHGTGTRAGDTTEIESLMALWKGQSATAGTCAIGSVKSMIGHLLTAAGAAGMIKILLAIRHRMLPPSIHFEAAPPDSPLAGSPFRVQSEAAAWETPKNGIPRRAAVSAFGFGGINAHILFEEWPENRQPQDQVRDQSSVEHARMAPKPLEPVAIVGMGVHAGSLDRVSAFEAAIFNGLSAIGQRPAGRWKGADAVYAAALNDFDPHGAYLGQVDVGIGEFQIPPNEIDAILPQQLLALKTGAAALGDAGLPLRESRTRMGVVVGINFDFESTNFHLRWQLFSALQRWRTQFGIAIDDQDMDSYLSALRDGCGPPLTAPRVMGALGGIVASRMAREFRFGGPSFVVSADTASGIKALRVAVDRLQQGEADAMLVGAVDLFAEGRSVVRMDSVLPLSRSNRIRPFDADADGTLPGDGGVALVLKPLSLARAQKDRIYAVIRGIGSAAGNNPATGRVDGKVYSRSLEHCFANSPVRPEQLSYVEAHGAGLPDQDQIELNALSRFFNGHVAAGPENAIALGATKPVCGHTGAADGLLALAKTALCLYRRTLPPLPGFTRLPDSIDPAIPFHIPRHCQPWYRNRDQGPRTAISCTMTVDGTCSHVLLQEEESILPEMHRSHPIPMGNALPGLFVVTGDAPNKLIAGLSDLNTHLETASQGRLEIAAARWLDTHPPDSDHKLAIALIIGPDGNGPEIIAQARQAVDNGASDPRSKRVFYRSQPMGKQTPIAMIYPGSGNHYLEMGRDLALRFPDILDGMDRDTKRLKTQMRPWHLMPWGQDWSAGWQQEANLRLKADILNMIFAQVVYGGLMTRILKRFAVPTDALIGYSLGESAALFAHDVWADRGDMLARMQATDLFSTQLAGPCRALRQAWKIPDETPVDWQVAVVNRPADQVRATIDAMANVRLLIVNSPDECVIGGLRPAIETAIGALGCQAIFLDGVVTVHCDAALPVAREYRDLHHFPTTPRSGLSVYSCSWAAPYAVTADKIADSIEKQAVDGFDFTRTIKRAYGDGIRIFVEAGPRASCTRMIDRILDGQDHLAVAANHSGESEIAALLRCLGRLVVERIPLDLNPLYEGIVESGEDQMTPVKKSTVTVNVGGQMLNPRLPAPTKPPKRKMMPAASPESAEASEVTPVQNPAPPPPASAEAPSPEQSGNPWTALMDTAQQTMASTAAAHEQFLQLSEQLTQSFADAFDLQNRLLGMGARVQNDNTVDPSPASPRVPVEAKGDRPATPDQSVVAFDRDMCMEFAIGSVGRMLGPAFDVVDTHRVRVRLPDEPLMLVDRILSVEGEMLSMGAGRVVTEHDVRPGAWYLDGERAPVCISVEAGQADLFLGAYLGIDHQVKGQRAYRLLDAVITFHRGLPRPGDTIRYEIAIDRFVRQGETWMFFFRFEGYIGNDHLITMRDGCAGFFTEAEVENSGGIILTERERQPTAGKCPPGWQSPVPMERESFTDAQVEALRRGDLAGCFGERFAGVQLAQSLWLPDGRMRLIHRIIDLDPAGGRYGLGLIRAEADVHPDDWFLTCHFVDDMVMPGTLMYECCAHALRVFLQRMGWITDKPGVCYEPVVGNAAQLKCRGPVTPKTAHVHYEIQISEIGYGPEPYVIADAHMFADGRPIVFFKDMSMKMTGVTGQEIEDAWRQRGALEQKTHTPLYDRASILSFAVGKPSEAFGEPYRVFDSQRTIARLPGPPYCFMDRVVRVEPPAWELKADGWVTAEYDIPTAAWYFAADRSGVMPFCVLLEIALQPCGWLAAYAGSALHSQQDLKFRNLGGSAVWHRQVTPDSGTLTMRCRMTKVSEAAEMIIENFDFEVLGGGQPVYTGDTYFGFFSAPALTQQKGLGMADPLVKTLSPFAGHDQETERLPVDFPLTPADAEGMPPHIDHLALPGKALLMIDRIDCYLPDGGHAGLGYIRGSKRVDPDEWFFKAHFYQDPVCPGSLGLESFLQLLKTFAIRRWPELTNSHRFRLLDGSRHSWSYRGQIIPKNKTVVVEASVTQIKDGPAPVIRADGLLWVDGLAIYKMENFDLALVPATGATTS
ncbi:beta-ketoacyl synthase N-terminal-like domain-containing protein [Desulfosarcina ovata]|uniref:beta-ketoacyl synthase N-terminal-like domain-containing protein n=1 Tax=Desulfosarcina ovata TaxID=83564 RepID=UPI0012D2E259|nr:beta-ketoacyl synthase N-terminal-like domain-containing protein [Desulfosarcina ovata]